MDLLPYAMNRADRASAARRHRGLFGLAFDRQGLPRARAERLEGGAAVRPTDVADPDRRDRPRFLCARDVSPDASAQPYIDFVSLAVVFILATLLGFASHAPGRAPGVFDAAMPVALPGIQQEQLVATLVVRILYFMIPFGISISIMGMREFWLNSTAAAGTAQAQRGLHGFGDRAAADQEPAAGQTPRSVTATLSGSAGLSATALPRKARSLNLHQRGERCFARRKRVQTGPASYFALPLTSNAPWPEFPTAR